MCPMRILHARLLAGFLLIPSAGTAGTVPPRPAGTGVAAGVVSAHSALPWIADDYTRAVAEARARKVPLFVESWAPW